MARFSLSRNWPFIAVLCVSLSCFALKPGLVRADPLIGETGDVGSGGNGNPTGIGDPDDPTGPGKNAKTGRFYSIGGSGLGMHAAGDGVVRGASIRSIVMWQAYVTWVEIRSWTFRF